MNASINANLKTLKLSGISKHWETVDFIDKEQFLKELIDIELKERTANRINRLLKVAGFPILKTLDKFVWHNNIQLPNGMTKEKIMSLDFIEEKENLLCMGAVGTGKSHLAIALAVEACQQGKKVKFFTAAGLGNTLHEKNQKGLLNRYMNTLKKADLIILDEVGFVPLHKDAAELLFQVVSECYERKSMIITSNLELSHWNTVFGDNRLTAALIDRLVHHSHILVFSGESYRLVQSMDKIKG